jgi:hypothetical protein
MKQTAVEWLEDMISKMEAHGGDLPPLMVHIQQAKEMEKNQMDKVAGDWWNEGASYMHDGGRKYESFEEYYNETFKQD